MTNEVEEVVKDEADWAMDYANERTRRFKAETRLASFMLDAPAFCVAVDDFIEAIFAPAIALGDRQSLIGREFISAMARVMQFSDDVGNNININIFDPVWGITDEEKTQLLTARSLKDIPRSYRDRVDSMIKAANESVFKDWVEICEGTHFAGPDEVNKKSKQRLMDLLNAVMGDEKRKHREN